ncbi:MAG TPA: hypothetical protein VGD13_04000 [Xanthobacteraceae bacterium]
MTRITFEKCVIGIGLPFGPEAAVPRRRPRILVKRNASKVARVASAVGGKSLIRMGIELTSESVALNGSVELSSIEGGKPGAKARQLARGKSFDGFFDVFGGGHDRDIAFEGVTAKGRRANVSACPLDRAALRLPNGG